MNTITAEAERIKANEKIYIESKGKPKKGDEVWLRNYDCNYFELGIFISKTRKGFKVYKYCIERNEHIDYFSQLTTKDPKFCKVYIFKTKIKI